MHTHSTELITKIEKKNERGSSGFFFFDWFNKIPDSSNIARARLIHWMVNNNNKAITERMMIG